MSVETNLKGKTVFVTDTVHNAGPQLEEAFADEGAKVVTGLDVSRETAVDVVVNNVLFPVQARAFSEVPFELWKRKIEVELTGSFFLFKAVLPHMIEQRWGRIINFTGLAAFLGTDPLAASTERGMIGMTRGIAREYGQYNITANCIDAGGKPEEVAFLAVSLAGESAGSVTGQCVLANGGKYFL
jgi:hypothetical protein